MNNVPTRESYGKLCHNQFHIFDETLIDQLYKKYLKRNGIKAPVNAKMKCGSVREASHKHGPKHKTLELKKKGLRKLTCPVCHTSNVLPLKADSFTCYNCGKKAFIDEKSRVT